MAYKIKRAAGPVSVASEWESADWKNIPSVKLEVVLGKTGSHRPPVELKMQYDDKNIYGLFQVKDQYVKAVATADQQSVCFDSCVEFFVRPADFKTYFNFEMNAGGTLLLYHVRTCRGGDYDVVPQNLLDTIERFHTLPHLITEEITDPVTWRLGFRIPLEFFRNYMPIDTRLSGQHWHANFTKCADKTSHPHWLSWQPLSKCDFHLPDEFGEIIFE